MSRTPFTCAISGYPSMASGCASRSCRTLMWPAERATRQLRPVRNWQAAVVPKRAASGPTTMWAPAPASATANASPDCPPAVEVAATPVEEAPWTSPTMVLWQLKTLSAAGCATWSIVAPRHSASPSRTPSRSTRVLASSPSGRISVGRFLLPLLPSTLLLCSFSSFLVRLQGPYKSEELEESSHHILEASDFSTLLVFLKYCFLLTFLSFFVRYWHLFIV